jgi:putative aminopeptidase FrvX
MLTDERKRMFKDLTEASGIAGFEDEIREVIKSYLPEDVDISYDKTGSLLVRKEGCKNQPVVMLSAHMDEVGFMVSHISPEGFIYFVPVGMWWQHVMLAQRVIVQSSKGNVPGFIGAKPPHLLSADDQKRMQEIHEMFIDVGAESAEEVIHDFGIRPGCPVIPDAPYKEMFKSDLLLAKAWDNRVGCALYIDLLKSLKDVDHPNTLVFAFTTQEEVGLRGAETAAAAIDPDACIVFDGCIANDFPGVRKGEPPVALGKGPNIIIMDRSHIPNRKMRDFAFSVAAEENIPLQPATLLGAGTDTGKILLHGQGVPSIALGVPRRYTHSHSSIIHYHDYESIFLLHMSLLQRMDAQTVDSFTAY